MTWTEESRQRRHLKLKDFLMIMKDKMLYDKNRRFQVKRTFYRGGFSDNVEDKILYDKDRRVQVKTTFKTEGFSDDNEGQDTL